MQSFFMPGEPVLRGAATPETVQRIRGIALLANDTAPETAPQAFADMITLITCLVLFTRAHTTRGRRAERARINAAREHILERAFQRIDFRCLATSLGLSYTLFRRVFQQETGHAPLAYQLDIRISRARVLLEQTDLSVSKIAQQTGFANGFYF